MDIRTFDDLVRAGLAQRVPQRLLLVFIRTEPVGEAGEEGAASGTLSPVMYTDKLLVPGLTLAKLVREADAQTPDWDWVMVAALAGRRRGEMPTPAQAEEALQGMVKQVHAGGDFSSFAIFDRTGNTVRLAVAPRG